MSRLTVREAGAITRKFNAAYRAGIIKGWIVREDVSNGIDTLVAHLLYALDGGLCYVNGKNFLRPLGLPAKIDLENQLAGMIEIDLRNTKQALSLVHVIAAGEYIERESCSGLLGYAIKSPTLAGNKSLYD